MTGPDKARLSIVVPLYNEEENIDALFARLLKIEAGLPVELEYVFVDDRSEDRTFELTRKLFSRHPRIHLIRFVRNSGSHAAVMAGLLKSTGDCAVFLAGDLQDPPEVLAEMLKRWQSGSRIVWAARTQVEGKSKKDSIFSSWYWQLSRFLTETDIPRSGIDFFMIDRAVIEAIRPHAHAMVPVFQLVANTGYKPDTLYYKKQDRKAGKSGWTLKKKLMLSLETALFSFKAVRILAVAGASLFLAGILTALVAIAAGALLHLNLTPLVIIAFVAAFTGLQMAMTGFVGEYTNVALKESRGMPRYIVEQSLSSSELGGSRSRAQDVLSFAPEETALRTPQSAPNQTSVHK